MLSFDNNLKMALKMLYFYILLTVFSFSFAGEIGKTEQDQLQTSNLNTGILLNSVEASIEDQPKDLILKENSEKIVELETNEINQTADRSLIELTDVETSQNQLETEPSSTDESQNKQETMTNFKKHFDISIKTERKLTDFKIIENDLPEFKVKETPKERELKDKNEEYSDTTDLSEVLSPISVSSKLNHSAANRELAGDGNPIWKPEFHSSTVDYFQIVIYDFDLSRNKMNEAKSFLTKWMNIDQATERLRIRELAIKNRKAKNRYTVSYSNSSTGISKDYYFDFDFSDGKADRNTIGRVRTVDYVYNQDSSENYLKSYHFTLEEDCRTIQQASHDPPEIKCIPHLTKENYVIPHVYDVEMIYKTGKKNKKVNRRFFVRSKIIGPDSSPLKPNPVELPKAKEIVDLIRTRIKSTPFFASKNKVLKELESPEIEERIDELTHDIADWENENRDKLRGAEESYIKNLGRILSKNRKQQKRDDRNFEKTYDVMRKSVSHINGYNVRMAIRKTVKMVEDRQVIRAYRAKTRYYQREMALIELIEKLDHMRYLADKHLDENFDHYYSPEYFK